MNLIDVLLIDLPKIKGVPQKWRFVFQDYDKELRFDGRRSGIRTNVLADNHRKNGEGYTAFEVKLISVTRNQYEDALMEKSK